MSDFPTERDHIYTWADVTPTIHKIDPTMGLAIEIWRLRDQEYEMGDLSRQDYLCDLATALEYIAYYDERCECTPVGALCYVCRKTLEAKRILEDQKG